MDNSDELFKYNEIKDELDVFSGQHQLSDKFDK